MTKKTKEVNEIWREDFYKLIEERFLFLKKQSELMEKNIQSFPDGMIHDIKRKGYSFQYYWRRNKKEICGEYLGKEKESLAKKLCQKYYFELLVSGIHKEMKLLETYLKLIKPDYLLKTFENLTEGKKRLVDPVVGKDDEYVKRWESAEYPPGYFPDGSKEYYTDKHERVHSKSEIIIANMLKANGIPYRYEYPFYINGIGEKRPDFYCLNVRLRKEFVWEHLGMMEIQSYAIDNVAKVNGFYSNGYFPGEKLILTFESSSGQLDTRIVQALIDKYLK